MYTKTKTDPHTRDVQTPSKVHLPCKSTHSVGLNNYEQIVACALIVLTVRIEKIFENEILRKVKRGSL